MADVATWFYSVDEKLDGFDEVVDSGFHIPKSAHKFAHDLEDVAAECGEDYHDNHDGWESSWPLTVYLYDGDGSPKGAFEVFREDRYAFYASQSDEGDD